MKYLKFKKSISVLLLTSLMLSITACGSNTDNTPKIDEATTKETEETNETQNIIEEIEKDKVDVLNFINTNYSSSADAMSETYNSPLYNLPNDYVFEFDCSEAASAYTYKAFKVFDNSNYEDLYNCSYAKVEYNDGKLTVSPDSVLYLNNTGSSHINDGTWGSLNKLYLVQYIDLETGKDLKKPIVTPFTIEHDLTSPTITQGVDENNSYIISWEPIEGAVEYRVFEHFGNTGYTLECTTTETTVSVEEFKTQQKSEGYMDLIFQDLENAGYETNNDGIIYMNRGVKYTDDFDGYFTVVAIDAQGNQSGISNIIDVREIANRLPYQIVDAVYNKEITSVEDIPTYVNVEMVDGSIQQMLINYHGAQTYKYTDNANKIGIQAHVSNTLFNNFLIVLTGMNYDNVMSDISYVTQRQDSLDKSGSVADIDATIPHVPSNTETETDKEVQKQAEDLAEVPVTPTNTDTSIPETEESESETTEETSVPETTFEPEEKPESTVEDIPETEEIQDFTTTDLMASAASEISNRLSNFSEEQLNDIIYANSDLEAWIALNLLAQMEIIVVPVNVFPEAANTDYLGNLLVEAYRQNPSSGMIYDIGYSYEYESLCLKYVESSDVRFAKLEEELTTAQQVSDTIITDSMSDYEKVVAINNYLCKNASYDFDSMETNIEISSALSESFVDAHTPYGILCKNYGVCESYSEAFALIGRMSGLDVIIETGTMHGGGHEWNRVYVDGSWCILDVTNNDIDLTNNALLNVSESQSSELLVPDGYAYIDYNKHRANDMTKEYYYNNNQVAQTKEEALSILKEQLKSNNIAVVRLPVGTSEDEAVEILKQLVKDEGITPKNARYIAGVIAIEKE